MIEVMHALLRADEPPAIVVKTSAPPRLFDGLGGRIELINTLCDTGMVQADSLNVDTTASLREAKAFQARLPALAAAEASFLRERRARVVVGDIPPLAFAAAAIAGVRSIAIGNFTWDWIYEAYPEESPEELVREIRSAYGHAAVALRLPMAGGFTSLEGITRDIPFIARQSTKDPDAVRRVLDLPWQADRPVVLVSFGGYGVDGLNSQALEELEAYSFVVGHLPARGAGIAPSPGVVHVPEQRLAAAGLTYQDLVRAADVVVTKPGYGIVSEAIANETALLYTSRGRFAEYAVMLREMPRYLRARFIDRDDLLSGRWAPALDALLAQPPPPETPALNGAEVAAEEILTLHRQNRTW